MSRRKGETKLQCPETNKKYHELHFFPFSFSSATCFAEDLARLSAQ